MGEPGQAWQAPGREPPTRTRHTHRRRPRPEAGTCTLHDCITHGVQLCGHTHTHAHRPHSRRARAHRLHPPLGHGHGNEQGRAGPPSRASVRGPRAHLQYGQVCAHLSARPRAGQGRAGRGRAGRGRAGQGRSGRGRTGQGEQASSGQGGQASRAGSGPSRTQHTRRRQAPAGSWHTHTARLHYPRVCSSAGPTHAHRPHCRRARAQRPHPLLSGTGMATSRARPPSRASVRGPRAHLQYGQVCARLSARPRAGQGRARQGGAGRRRGRGGAPGLAPSRALRAGRIGAGLSGPRAPRAGRAPRKAGQGDRDGRRTSGAPGNSQLRGWVSPPDSLGGSGRAPGHKCSASAWPGAARPPLLSQGCSAGWW